MAPLKAEGMAQAMETSLGEEWSVQKGVDVPMPGGGVEDRKLLFTAIARGVLKYLEDNQNEFINSITFQVGSVTFTRNVTGVDLNIDA